MQLSERIHPEVTRSRAGIYTIDGLSEDEFAYIVALLGTGNSLVGENGVIGTEPLIPAASGLYAKLAAVAAQHGLSDTIDAVEHAQSRWQRKTRTVERRAA